MTAPLANIPAEIATTREAWLMRAIEALRPRFAEVGAELPALIHVSVGFGGTGMRGESKMVLGATWARRASKDGANHVFISPVLSDTARVLDVLIHELIHVADDNQSGHKGLFAEWATRLGLTGKMTATVASIELAAEMITLAAVLGDYPHAAIIPMDELPEVPTTPGAPAPRGRITSGPKTQTTRMLKVVCQDAGCECGGYTVRTTARWLEVGTPRCPFGGRMDRA